MVQVKIYCRGNVNRNLHRLVSGSQDRSDESKTQILTTTYYIHGLPGIRLPAHVAQTSCLNLRHVSRRVSRQELTSKIRPNKAII